MNILEKDIEELIFENIEDSELMKRHGFRKLEKKYYRQPNLGTYGIADLIGVSITSHSTARQISFTVYEIKKEQINTATLIQASRYIKGLKHLMKRFNHDKIVTVRYNVVLIGKSLDTGSDFVFLLDLIDNLTTYTYELDFIRGLVFVKHCGYDYTNQSEIDLSDYHYDIVKGNLHTNKVESF